MEEKAKKSQSKADIMEQLSRSLQTERNVLKQTIKELEEKLPSTKVAEPVEETKPVEETAPVADESNSQVNVDEVKPEVTAE